MIDSAKEMPATEKTISVMSQPAHLQKMAKKRSFVDGILSITGASRIFTQDVEDMAGDQA